VDQAQEVETKILSEKIRKKFIQVTLLQAKEVVTLKNLISL
jgi:hypothetical protein